jgi:hypothetical protein
VFFFEKHDTEKSETVTQKNLAAASSDHRGREKRTTVSGRHSQRARERARREKNRKEKKRKGRKARVGGVVVVALARVQGAGCCSTGDGTACGTRTTT